MSFAIHSPKAVHISFFTSSDRDHGCVTLVDANGDKLEVYTDPDTARKLAELLAPVAASTNLLAAK